MKKDHGTTLSWGGCDFASFNLPLVLFSDWLCQLLCKAPLFFVTRKHTSVQYAYSVNPCDPVWMLWITSSFTVSSLMFYLRFWELVTPSARLERKKFLWGLLPQERQDLLSTCLHAFLRPGIALWHCAGIHCSELSSSLWVLYGKRKRHLKPV